MKALEVPPMTADEIARLNATYEELRAPEPSYERYRGPPHPGKRLVALVALWLGAAAVILLALYFVLHH